MRKEIDEIIRQKEIDILLADIKRQSKRIERDIDRVYTRIAKSRVELGLIFNE